MRLYKFDVTPRLVKIVAAETLEEAECEAFGCDFGGWRWEETVGESVQQETPDGKWGPVMEDA